MTIVGADQDTRATHTVPRHLFHTATPASNPGIVSNSYGFILRHELLFVQAAGRARVAPAAAWATDNGDISTGQRYLLAILVNTKSLLKARAYARDERQSEVSTTKGGS